MPQSKQSNRHSIRRRSGIASPSVRLQPGELSATHTLTRRPQRIVVDAILALLLVDLFSRQENISCDSGCQAICVGDSGNITKVADLLPEDNDGWSPWPPMLKIF